MIVNTILEQAKNVCTNEYGATGQTKVEFQMGPVKWGAAFRPAVGYFLFR